MIIAVDYDDTLEIGGRINEGLLYRLRAEQKNGNIIILWTCRQGDRLKQALNELAKYGLKPNLVNENHISSIQKLGYNPRKVLADVYIDDKNVRI